MVSKGFPESMRIDRVVPSESTCGLLDDGGDVLACYGLVESVPRSEQVSIIVEVEEVHIVLDDQCYDGLVGCYLLKLTGLLFSHLDVPFSHVLHFRPEKVRDAQAYIDAKIDEIIVPGLDSERCGMPGSVHCIDFPSEKDK